MYIDTIPRKLGGLGRHLMDTGRGSNERVVLRPDLSRDVPTDVTLALRLLAAPARRVRRMKRDVVHIVVSPERTLSADEMEHVLRTIEVEYCISEGSARLVVEHRKGRRAGHFHIVFSMASEASGKALRFTRSGDRDEMLARRLELELGEPLQPSSRIERTVELLRERGLDDLAERAAKGPLAKAGLRQSKAETQQAARLEADLPTIDDRVLLAWRASGGDLQRIAAALEAAGFALCAGDRIVDGRPMVRLMDRESLMTTSLTRHVNRVTKRAGEPARLQETEVGQTLGPLPPEKALRVLLTREAPQRSAEALTLEFDRFIEEAGPEADQEQARKARAAREKLAARLTAEEKFALRQRQMLVKAHYRERDRVRRARVNRAFIAAGVFADPGVRKLAFYLVAAGALATGAGLLAALTVAGVAVATLPSFTSARQARADADRAMAKDRLEQAVELKDIARDFFRERAAHQRRRQREEARAQELRRRAQIHRKRGRGVDKGTPPPAKVRQIARQRPVHRRGGPER